MTAEENNLSGLKFEQYQSIRHGGDLHKAIRQYGGKKEEWLDMSTGISPWAYPVTNIPNALWCNLPESCDKLTEAASSYYSYPANQIVVTPGSQLAIRLLPTLIGKQQIVGVPMIGYQEHVNAWQSAGHKIIFYQNIEELEQLCCSGQVDSAIVINPNNPTGELVPPDRLHEISNKLSGLLVVDEAFVDITPNYSTLNSELASNTIVLRSIGKFFGLAGARIGFMFGSNPINHRLKNIFTPWTISGPSQHIATRALLDTHWQAQQNSRISQQCNALERDLRTFIKKQVEAKAQLTAIGLFNTLTGSSEFIEDTHIQLANSKIWTRIGDDQCGQNWIRFSLPGNEYERFKSAIEDILTAKIIILSRPHH